MKRNKNAELKEVIRKYLGNKCSYCENKQDLDIHHITPINYGGSNELSNLELLCKKCHSKIHATYKKFFPKKDTITTYKCRKCEKTVFLRRFMKKVPLCKFCKEGNKILKNKNARFRK